MISIHRTRDRKLRRGYLMLDLIIVMSLTVVVMSTSSIWLYKTMQYSSSVHQRDLHARNISRISRQLRTDASDADSLSIEAKTLTFSMAKTEIEYSIDNNKIHRTMTGGKQTHHDDFAFADNVLLTWSNDEGSGSASLEIRRDFSAKSPSKNVKSKRFDAVISVRAAKESK